MNIILIYVGAMQTHAKNLQLTFTSNDAFYVPFDVTCTPCPLHTITSTAGQSVVQYPRVQT